MFSNESLTGISHFFFASFMSDIKSMSPLVASDSALRLGGAPFSSALISVLVA